MWPGAADEGWGIDSATALGLRGDGEEIPLL